MAQTIFSFRIERGGCVVGGEFQRTEWSPETIALAQPFVREPLLLDKLDSWRTYTGDPIGLMRAVPGLNVTIIGEEITAQSMDYVIRALRHIEERLREPRAPFNERVSVAVPGLGLLAIEQVRVEYDCCTDTLNEMLSKGWRIVAACPQPDKRRPDYVLGRSIPNTEA